MAKNQAMINLKSIFTQTVEEEQASLAEIFDEWQVVNQHFVGDNPAALKQIDLRLREYKERNKQATLVVLQSGQSAEHLQINGIPSLMNDFPVLKLAPSPSDSDFPALEWIKYACKRSLASYTEVVSAVQMQIMRSRYSFVPVCNLGEDTQLSLIDTLLARQLTMGNQLVWYSDTTQPDLGGNEDKNYRRYFQEEIENPE